MHPMNELDSKLQETHTLMDKVKSILEKIEPLEERIKKAEELAEQLKEKEDYDFLSAKKEYENQKEKIIKSEVTPLMEKIRGYKDDLVSELCELRKRYTTINAKIKIEEELEGSQELIESLKREVGTIKHYDDEIENKLEEISNLELMLSHKQRHVEEPKIDESLGGGESWGGRESWSGRYT